MIVSMAETDERAHVDAHDPDAPSERGGEESDGRGGFEIGLTSFGERSPDPQTGRTMSYGERIRNLLEEITLADQVGLDVYGVGEHHRTDFVVSSPATVLAAAAARTERIRLSSAVSVLSSDDPIRVFQQFATVDLLSRGRAEIMAGRGSFVESFPLFGYDLQDYDELFREKLDLLLAVRAAEVVSWEGSHRAPLRDQVVVPRAEQDPLPVWIAVGGTPQSVVRAASLELPLMLAIIGGAPERFRPFVELYRETARRSSADPAKLAVGTNSHGYVTRDEKTAADEYWPPYAAAMSKIGRERGWSPMTREQYDMLRSLRGALLVGSPEQVIEKILFQHELFAHDRFLLQIGVGSMPHDQVLKSIELFGTEVAPVVRREIASRSASAG